MRKLALLLDWHDSEVALVARERERAEMSADLTMGEREPLLSPVG